MKSIATCYSEHAIKVSDSYCSAPLSNNQAYIKSSSKPLTTILPSNSIQDSVTCIYKVKLSTGSQIRIQFTWPDPLKQRRGFGISVSDHPFSLFKFSKNTVIVGKPCGAKTYESCRLVVELLWDLNRAKYNSGPEPVTGFYVAVSVNSELCLILGDMEERGSSDDVKKRVSDVKISESWLMSRYERFSSSTIQYSTKAKFCETGMCHDIMIKCLGSEAFQNPVLCVYIDKKSVIHVERLQWNFRGNQIIFMDGLLVDVMWDLHDWFYGTKSSKYGVFLFRTRSGLDSRLWLEEKNLDQNDHQQGKNGFSLLICACKIPD